MPKEDMEELLIRSLRGDASEFERQQVLAWRRASLENEKRFREMSRLWALAAIDEPADYPPKPSADELLERARSRGVIRHVIRHRAAALLKTWPGRAVAAAILLAAGFGAADLLFSRSKERPFGAEEFVTGPSQTVTVSLRDGSVVRLGPQSRLRLAGESSDREVSLEGRAYFAVVKDPDHPFRVRTRAGEARVLGTQFDLSTSEGGLRLVVVEGRVRLTATGKGGGVEVRAGQVSRVIDGAKPTVVSVREPMAELGWVADLLVFQATPLDQAVRELEKRYGVHITPVDSVLAKRTVSAWFSGRSLEEVLAVVCRVVEATCSIDADTVTIGH